ncbi:hypothetical protein B9N62_10180 [Campylobacter concisus]|uniref:Putative exodeoxyribonuclease 8 PDDEXK-like domain-containing protein n=1 Tax=Campylobacter concisus TaxID=199 RepID=A0A1Y5MPD1_9BACT|nr:PD-(D/E)XK nuclease-like domain-containing protein [Campylobacter concisus]OUT10426.1 hypothetical protein B9N62_10180 [Campylobacter concisus]
MLTNKEYHARPEISKSDLDLLAKSPLHLKMKNELKSEPTKALLLGSAVHKLVLEPKDFSNEFSVEPEVDKRTKEGKAIHEEFLKKLGGKTPINWASIRTALKVANSINSMYETAEFLKDGLAEQSYFSEIEGVAVKCRPDFYNEKMGAVIDLKTTSDASATGFARSVASFNYHVQAAFYSDILRSLGKEVNYFLFIAVETKAPYFVGFYELDAAAIEQGRKTYLELLELYKFCRDHNQWWGYAKKDGDKIKAVQTLSLPAWKFYEQIA